MAQESRAQPPSSVTVENSAIDSRKKGQAAANFWLTGREVLRVLGLLRVLGVLSVRPLQIAL